MRKIALVIVLAVLGPSLALAWLAMHSLRDQQFLLERQQAQLAQADTDAVVGRIANGLAQQQQEFGALVESMAAGNEPARVRFDEQLIARWPLAEVGFCVTTAGVILSPMPKGREIAQNFRLENSGFLGNREPVEVYWNVNTANNSIRSNQIQPSQTFALNSGSSSALAQNNFSTLTRQVMPQSQQAFANTQNNASKVLPAPAEFSQLVSGGTDGLVARFLQNELKLLCWHRLATAPDLVFGAQLNLERVVEALRPLVQPDEALRGRSASRCWMIAPARWPLHPRN